MTLTATARSFPGVSPRHDCVGWRFWLPLAVILGVAGWIRFYHLGVRPMHADEANQAVKLGLLLETGDYAFDPRDHHGPTLYYLGLVPAWLRGERTLAELGEVTVRLTPAIFGVMAVGLLALAAVPLGRAVALLASVFLAIAPAAVYYSRYFIQETLLVTFALGALVAARRWREKGTGRWALMTGVAIGLMQATKASAPVFVFAAILAWGLAVMARPRRLARTAEAGIPAPSKLGSEIRTRGCLREWGLAALGFGGVVVLFYSSFFTHAAGLRDMLVTYGPMSGRVGAHASGHEKPWWYYGALFWRQSRGGYVWDQSWFLVLTLLGLAASIISRNALARGVAWYAFIVGAAISITPYKTPWIVTNVIPAMAVLAAVALVETARRSPWLRVPAAVAFLVVVAWQAGQVRQAVFLRPADARNPFAYVHAAPDVLKIPPLAQRAGNGAIKVISEEYWPLPWYLRAYPNVGYWTEAPEDCDAALVIASSNTAEAVRSRLKGTYRESFLGLRPGFVLIIFERNGAE